MVKDEKVQRADEAFRKASKNMKNQRERRNLQLGLNADGSNKLDDLFMETFEITINCLDNTKKIVTLHDFDVVAEMCVQLRKSGFSFSMKTIKNPEEKI